MKKALCVGINHFMNYPTSSLQGCVNDVNDMVDVLKTLLGFTSGDITTLTDTQATKANIMAHLKAMLDGARAGKYSYLVFSISSHGTQVPDTSGDEPDRFDEAYCPHDLAAAGGKWDPNHVIIDDELHDLFVQLPSNVLLEVYADTCHSGDSLKAIDLLPDRKPRYLPPPSLEEVQKVTNRRARGIHKALLEKGIVHHILWAACRSNQTSADAYIASNYHGAFTYYFCKEMRACHNQLARKDVLAKVRADLLAAHFTQIPQLECEATVRRTITEAPPLKAEKAA